MCLLANHLAWIMSPLQCTARMTITHVATETSTTTNIYNHNTHLII